MSKKVHELYHKGIKRQDRVVSLNSFTYKTILTYLNKCLVKPTGSVLDIGCGAGTLSFYLADRGYTVTGIDISDRAVRSCRESANALDLKNISFEVLNFPLQTPKEKFDLIVLSEVIEHIGNDDLVLEKIYNLLNKGGTLFLTTPSANAPLHRLGLTKEFDKRVGHVRRYTEKELIKKLKENNFKIKEFHKTESGFRNFLFINPIAGKFIRFIKFFLVDIFTAVDNILVKFSGESQFIVIATKS